MRIHLRSAVRTPSSKLHILFPSPVRTIATRTPVAQTTSNDPIPVAMWLALRALQTRCRLACNAMAGAQNAQQPHSLGQSPCHLCFCPHFRSSIVVPPIPVRMQRAVGIAPEAAELAGLCGAAAVFVVSHGGFLGLGCVLPARRDETRAGLCRAGEVLVAVRGADRWIDAGG